MGSMWPNNRLLRFGQGTNVGPTWRALSHWVPLKFGHGVLLGTTSENMPIESALD